jgi:ferredoxin
VKVRVNQDLCEGYGTCVEDAPEVFQLDDWGYAVALNEGVVAAEHEAGARRAALDCPMNAIAIEDAS